ncbi:MAG TPA: flagellar hook-associated protein FlgL [Accumulibacter sp.]|jgi:flagellar hook-associated protein 3 FlgL|nr:flagellar hook-associated protein FlgL [Accumulibacter sp.]HQC79395.1 flagellar hook-associated protein FlgL [Accumulibacter sp.]
MRISTSQIYDSGMRHMGRTQTQLARLQQQLSTGRRLLSPSDDPTAASQALVMTQTKDVGEQYMQNQGDVKDELSLIESHLTAFTDLLQSVRSRIVQAGNTTLLDSDREAIAATMDSGFDEMLSIANSRSAVGDFLFAGYQGETTPFVRGTATSPQMPVPVVYHGDDGERLVQVAASQQVASNVAGSDVFMNIREGNGSFSTTATGNGAGVLNQGSGVIDNGSVLDLQKWQTALENGFPWQGSSNRALQIQFSAPGGVKSYQLFDVSTPPPPAVALPPVAVSSVMPFSAGQSISLVTTTQPPAAAVSTDFGAQVTITGLPVAGDTFTIRPSANKSVFETVQDAISLLRTPLTTSTIRTDFTARLQDVLTNLDNALVNVERVQASVGSRLQALDSLDNSASSLDVLYQGALSDLQDLDYAQAISDFTKQQISLEAAQKSYVQISGLSLFKYI